MREMEVGHWYTFRVAAVDARGSAGFVESPVPFRLQTEPTAPSPPYNLTAIESTVSGATVQNQISWIYQHFHRIKVAQYMCVSAAHLNVP